MHSFLTRLGVKPEVQEFFLPFYRSDLHGNLVFNYGGETETYGFAFHRVPSTRGIWMAGEQNYRFVKQVFICSSALDAISFLNFRYSSFPAIDSLLFISLGSRLHNPQQIDPSLAEKKYSLLFGNDFLGNLADITIAAGIRRIPMSVWERNGITTVYFRHKSYVFETQSFSLNAFEKLSGYRFGIRTFKSRSHLTFFEQLKATAF